MRRAASTTVRTPLQPCGLGLAAIVVRRLSHLHSFGIGIAFLLADDIAALGWRFGSGSLTKLESVLAIASLREVF